MTKLAGTQLFAALGSVEEQDACFVVRDDNTQAPAYVCYTRASPAGDQRPSCSQRRGAPDCGEYC